MSTLRGRHGLHLDVLLAGACVIAVFAIVPACSSEEIVLAKLPPTRDSGQPSSGKKCVDDTDCDEQSFCARAMCSDVGGACESRPVVCDGQPRPVCGCDGITYWNDCLRRAAGVTSMAPDECTINPQVAPRMCDGSEPRDAGGPGGPGPGGPGGPGGMQHCPLGTYCARLLPPFADSPGPQPPRCPPDIPGTCWALPAVCPPESGPDRWLSCALKPGCLTTCDAIRSGEPHARAKQCF